MNKGLYRFSAEISANLGNVPNMVEGRLADLIDVLIKVHGVVKYNTNVSYRLTWRNWEVPDDNRFQRWLHVGDVLSVVPKAPFCHCSSSSCYATSTDQYRVHKLQLFHGTDPYHQTRIT